MIIEETNFLFIYTWNVVISLSHHSYSALGTMSEAKLYNMFTAHSIKSPVTSIYLDLFICLSIECNNGTILIYIIDNYKQLQEIKQFSRAHVYMYMHCVYSINNMYKLVAH